MPTIHVKGHFVRQIQTHAAARLHYPEQQRGGKTGKDVVTCVHQKRCNGLHGNV